MKCRRSLVIAGVAFVLGIASTAHAGQPAPDAKKQGTVVEATKAEAGEAKKPEVQVEKPFSELVKEARTVSGLFNLFQTEEKVYLEVRPDQFDRLT